MKHRPAGGGLVDPDDQADVLAPNVELGRSSAEPEGAELGASVTGDGSQVKVGRLVNGQADSLADGWLGDSDGCGISQGAVEAMFGARFGLALRYRELLAHEGIEWGLLGPREADRLWCRHIMNSAAICELIPNGATVLDVGSGAGLPGIPLALARPDLNVTLLDSLLRRTKFLELVVDQLGLAPQASVVRARVEESRQRYDVVVCRAVASLAKLVRWCEPVMAGSLLALKGDSAGDELAAAEPMLRQRGLSARVLTLEIEGSCQPTVVVQVKLR